MEYYRAGELKETVRQYCTDNNIACPDMSGLKRCIDVEILFDKVKSGTV